jgi:hypothetical protein
MEQHLPGGFVTTVVRAGDTVRRRPSPNAAFVHDLLRFLEARGWDGAPRFLGVDAHGREVLSYLEGHVPWAPGAGQAAEVASDDSLAEVARLVRQLHDLTAGTPLAGPAEVVCHNDLSPRNTVYRDTGYGLEDRTRLVETILWWQDRCRRGIESGAAAGDPAMTRLRAHGAAADVRAAHAWVATHRAELEAAVA